MAQNYEIDVMRFNGQDYDTLLPTPASHASTHQAGGSDPITVKTGNIENSAVTNSKLAPDSVGTSKMIDGAVSAPKIYYGALVAIKNFSIENSEWTENSYGTYNKTVTINGIDPAKHIGFLCLTRSVKIPGVDTAWGFSSSMLDLDNEKMSCIFGCKITAVNELTLTAIEPPSGTIYLTLAVMHI